MNKLEICGYCGSYFRGNHLLTLDECKQLTQEEMDKAPLGYCPNAQAEDYAQNPENYHQTITKDMAIDAGMPQLEGTQI